MTSYLVTGDKMFIESVQLIVKISTLHGNDLNLGSKSETRPENKFVTEF